MLATMPVRFRDIFLLQEKLKNTNLKFNPVALASSIVLFEKAYHVRLPEDYKYFVQYIGNGGDGPPANGIHPLGVNEALWTDDQRNAWLNFHHIRQDFPFTETASLKNNALAALNGNIYLGRDNDGSVWTLIVSGKQKGFVWKLGENICPCNPSLRFVDWYNHWLDEKKASTRFTGLPL